MSRNIKYEIWQMTKFTNGIFKNLPELKPRGTKLCVELSQYDKVYTGKIANGKAETVLEKMFRIFNLTHPQGFPQGFFGHSLSVSDIVKLGDSWFYCQMVGWKEVDVWDIRRRC